LSTLIIAEAGVNHNGDLSTAKELIYVAANSGANFVKFQSFKADEVVHKSALKARYQVFDSSDSESQYELLKRLELDDSYLSELIQLSESLGISFMSTAFDVKSANKLLSLRQNIFKIPSGEITNLPYLRHIGGFRKKIILSTGMSNIREIKAAIEVLEVAGTPRSNITVLHCTSSYPTPMSDVNLKAMKQIKETLEVAVGYSDHTLGIEVAVAAVALGATIIEKHFTLDRNQAGPDHKASLEPKELSLMVSEIRNIEKALGDGMKRPMPSEIENINVVRRSIVAKRNISQGEVFTEHNLTAKRPATGISPMHWDRIIGSRAVRDFSVDEIINET
jgi:N,N'-diacetyllegionaminate synthase